MRGEPRTWTLRASSSDEKYERCAAILDGHGTELKGGEVVCVVELEAVLDLLRECEPFIYGCGLPVEDRLEAFLTAHSRGSV